MSIRQKQIAKSANSVINGFLKAGVFPDIQSVISGVGNSFKGRQVGTPSTNYSPFIANSVTDPVALTNLTNSISDDVENLYQESVDQVNRIVRDFDYKSTWRQRIAQRMLSISANLAGVAPTPPYVIKNVVSSVSDIDAVNTSAFINFLDFSVELPSLSTRTAKVDLSTASISWNTSSTRAATYGALTDITTDSANSAFVVRATDSSTSSYFTLKLSLPQASNVSHVVLVGHTSAPANVVLNIDGESMPSQNIGLSRRASWAFSARDAKNITFTIHKISPDSILGNDYIFDYGVQSVSLYYEEYSQSAVFQTNRLDFGGAPLGSITIDAQQTTPGNTSIEWSYSVSGVAGNFEPIIPGVPKRNLSSSATTLKKVLPVQYTQSPSSVKSVDPSSGAVTGPVDTDMPIISAMRGGRTPLFNLCRIPNTITPNNTTINRGRNAWKVRSYHYAPAASNLYQDSSPTLSDFADPRGDNPQIYFRYQPAEFDLANQYPGLSSPLASALRMPSLEYPLGAGNDKVMHIFSARIITNPSLNSAQLQALSNTQVTLPAIFANHRGAVYLNGKPVPLLTNYTPNLVQGTASLAVTMVLPFKPGTNYLQIVTNNYAALSGGAFEFGSGVFSVLCTPGGQLSWYADDGPLEEVSLYELQFQTSRNDFSRFAITDDTQSGQKIIVVRELPTTVYDISYNVLTSLGSPTNLLLRASLTGDSSNPTVTPKISNFSVINSYV